VPFHQLHWPSEWQKGKIRAFIFAQDNAMHLHPGMRSEAYFPGSREKHNDCY